MRNRSRSDVAYDVMMDEQRRMEELQEKGLCHSCGENPQNPAVGPPFCLDCFKSSEFSCYSSGCVNGIAGSFMQIPLCEVHLINTIQDGYKEYLKRKSDLEEIEENFYTKMDELEFNDVREVENLRHERGLSEDEENLIKHWVAMKTKESMVKTKKNDIKKAMRQVDQAFPENYSTPI